VPSLSVTLQGDKELRASILDGSSVEGSAKATFGWELNGKKIADGPVLNLDRLAKGKVSSLKVILMDGKGLELSRQGEAIRIGVNKASLMPPRETER
jgi:hypothetical protein